MSTSTWGEPESYADDVYPPALLKYLLKQIMAYFAAQGGCIALFDESIGQMRVHLHLRIRNSGGLHPPGRRMTVHLNHDGPASSTPPYANLGRMQHLSPDSSEQPVAEEVEELAPQSGQLFARGTLYPLGDDLIGFAWQKNVAYIMSYEDYLATFHERQPLPAYADVTPTSFLVVPVRESTLIEEAHGNKPVPRILGVIVLYQTYGAGFMSKQRKEALSYVERIALYLQNERLRRAQQRNSMYLQLLQDMSATFPTSVKLSDVVEAVYEFTCRVVDVSAMQLTLYDRDTDRIYDVFAVNNGVRVQNLIEQPHTLRKEERPVWWQIAQQMAQKELKRLQFSPAQDIQQSIAFRELLVGIWGDQRHAETFLLLPMKMFNRVTGSLSITSMRRDAYRPEEIQVLETMVQIVTVSIENAKLYERDRQLLRDAQYREEQLAAMNSSLQSISSTLDLKELLTNLVKSVAVLVNAEMCVFFQLAPERDELLAKAIYGKPGANIHLDDGSGMPALLQQKGEHDDLIERIRIPFKGTFLETLSGEGFFYLTQSQMEELAQQSAEGGAIFLMETELQQMLMIPVAYKSELMGMLAIHTPRDTRIFHPRAIGTLLAICSQAANAIHTAQLFEQRELAYAELERMSKLKDEFIVTASHELRTPLTAITGYSSHLRRQSGRLTPQQIGRFAAKIASAAQQLTDLMESMSEAAKVGVVDKKLDLQMGPVQILAAAEMAYNLLSVNVEQQILLSVPSDIWVYGDALRIRQVMSNLLDNAAKYSPAEGQIQLTASVMSLEDVVQLIYDHQIDPVELLTKGRNPVVVVRVKDQGEGILPDDQQRIFEKFVRAPRSLTTPVRGSGLGLFICRRYIEAMNGWLWLEQSVPGGGSTFSFYLPMIETPMEVERQDEQA
jgi:signal transduction histidine kinase